MSSRIFAAASLLSAFAASLPAADPQLLRLIMPNPTVISDVNVAQVKVSPFGQYVLSQASNDAFQEFITLTGFDPRQDLTEVLCATGATNGAKSGLALATGIFNPTKIAALATQEKSVSEIYQGVTIYEDPKQQNGVAFLNTGLMAAGNIADVKAAIGRQTAPTTLPSALMSQITQLGNLEDAWVLSTVSPASLNPQAATTKPETIDGITVPANVLQQVTSGWAGVKFGSNINVTAQATTDTAATATNLANMLQFLQNLAQMQATQNPQAASLAKSVAITSSGNTVNITASLPEDQFQTLIHPRVQPRSAHKRQ
jgi:hypothetical protein